MTQVSGAARPAPGTTLRRVSPNKPPMRRRTFYCPDKLWDAALDVAADNEENIADVLRAGLERYVKAAEKRDRQK